MINLVGLLAFNFRRDVFRRDRRLAHRHMSEFRSRQRGAVADGISLRQFGNLHGMFAGGRTQSEQSFLGLLQAAGIGVGIFGQAGEHGFRLRQRFLGTFESGQRGGDGVIGGGIAGW